MWQCAHSYSPLENKVRHSAHLLSSFDLYIQLAIVLCFQQLNGLCPNYIHRTQTFILWQNRILWPGSIQWEQNVLHFAVVTWPIISHVLQNGGLRQDLGLWLGFVWTSPGFKHLKQFPGDTYLVCLLLLYLCWLLPTAWFLELTWDMLMEKE